MANTIGYGQGAVNNTNAWGQGAKSGSSFSNLQSLEFDGIDDYVEVADADNLSFGNGTTDSPFSISAWIKMDRINRFRIISKYQAPNYEYQFDVGSTNKLELYIFDGTNYRGRLFSTDLNTGQWYHVTATYSGVGGTNAQNGIKLYVDGVRVDDTTDTNGTYVAMHNTSANVHIGQLASTYTNGKIDEVAIFNSELSASDISTIYNTGVPNNISSISGLVSWWRFEGTGTTATDSGSGGNDGTLTNGVTRSSDVPT